MPRLWAPPPTPPLTASWAASSGAEQAKTVIGEVQSKAQEAAGTKVSIPIEAPGAAGVIAQLQQIISLAGQAKSAAAGASAAAGSLKGSSGGSSASFSDGVTPGRGAG